VELVQIAGVYDRSINWNTVPNGLFNTLDTLKDMHRANCPTRWITKSYRTAPEACRRAGLCDVGAMMPAETAWPLRPLTFENSSNEMAPLLALS
jgi:hypothetical protein